MSEDPPCRNEQAVILLYGVEADGRTTCVNVTGYRPYFYVEVGKARDSIFLNHRTLGALREYLGLWQDANAGVSMEVVSREGLYFANYDPEKKCRRKFAVVKISAPTRTRLAKIFWKIASTRREREPFRVGTKVVELFAHEFSRVDPLMQFRCTRNLPAAGWITVRSFKTCRNDASKHSTCDLEILCRALDLSPTPEDAVPCSVPPLNVVIFDLETYSSDWSRVSDSSKESDEIFQVSFASSRGERIVVVSKPIDHATVREGIKVVEVESEKELLKTFPKILCELNPHFISGYNIFGFDFPYLFERATLYGIQDLVFSFARVTHPAQMKHIEWDSKGRGVQDYQYPAAEGRAVLDLLVYVKKTYTSFHSYRLDAVAQKLLDACKDPFTHRDIFRSFAGLDTHGNPLPPAARRRLMTTCLNYCMQDSDLTLRLFTTQCVDLVMSQTASVTNTDINQIASRGETILNFNLIYKFCSSKDILVENKERYGHIQSHIYSGATVLEPDAGIHENVVSFDFAALYPSVIRAFNIDYTTLVDETDPLASLIPDEDCHVMEWTQHQGCEHDPAMIRREEIIARRETLMAEMSLLRAKKFSAKDGILKILRNAQVQALNTEKLAATEELKKYVKTKYTICKSFRFRYLKQYEGVIPTVVVNLLTARKNIKRQIVELRAKWTAGGAELTLAQARELEVLDKRQLAFKITANSMFGVMGARQGMLTFMPGAISTTAGGRQCIAQMIDLFHQKYNARVIYGDTDSNYVILDPTTYSTPSELWTLCGRIAKEITATYPDAITLEFEDAIYSKFLIPKKKKYLHRKIGPDGEIIHSLQTKGSCLVRRDTFGFMRSVFRDLVTMIFDGANSVEVVATFIAEKIRELYSRSVPLSELVLTKSVKTLVPAENYSMINGVCHLGSYAIRKFPANLSPKNAWENLVPLLPEHATVAYLLKKRGAEVSPGSRIEYVYVEPLDASHSRSSQQVESVYYLDRSLRDIHVERYASRLKQPIEQILPFVNRALAGAVERQIAIHTHFSRVMGELKGLFTPDIIFERKRAE